MKRKPESTWVIGYALAVVVAIFCMAIQAEAQDEPAATTEASTTASTAGSQSADEPQVADIPVVYRAKTLIKIKGKSKAEGVVELVVQPQGEEATKVRVNVLAKTPPKKVTDDLQKELDFAIDERYEVKRAGDQQIKIKAKKKAPPIAITIATQSLSETSVTISEAG